MNLFKFPIPNFNDKSKSTIFWRHMRFYSRKFLYYPQVKFLEKTLNMKGNEHLKNFFQIDPMLVTMLQEDFAIKVLKQMNVLKHLFMMLIRDSLVLNFFPRNK